MGVQQELEKHYHAPRREALEFEYEKLSYGIKKVKEVLELEEGEMKPIFDLFLQAVREEIKKAETGRDNEYELSKHFEYAGKVKMGEAILNWKEFYLNKVKEWQNTLNDVKEELDNGKTNTTPEA
jgi:hypothetical protein